MSPEDIKLLLDEAWHALFHMDIRLLRKHTSAEATETAYQHACEDAEDTRTKISAAIAGLHSTCEDFSQ